MTGRVRRDDDRVLAGALLMLAAMVVVPWMDGIAKYLGGRYPVMQIVWARYFFHVVVLLPVVLWRHPVGALWPRRPAVQILRGGLLFGSTALIFAAIRAMPLADALALVFVAPLVVTALSPLVLAEAVGARRWGAVVVGFLGAMLVVRPGAGAVAPAALLALAAGGVHGLYYLTTRLLAGSAPALITLLYTALLGAVVSSAAVPFVWVAPSPFDFALMAAIGVIALLGHLLVIMAFERAPASLLAPLGYAEIVMMTAIGWMLFGDFPGRLTLAGIAVIVASGLYIARRGRRGRAAPAQPL